MSPEESFVISIWLIFFLLSLVLPWKKWLFCGVMIFVSISAAIWLEHLIVNSVPHHSSVVDAFDKIFIVFIHLSFAAGFFLRMVIVGLLSLTSIRCYGDLRPAIDVLKKWWCGKGSLQIGLVSKYQVTTVFAIILLAGVIFATEYADREHFRLQLFHVRDIDWRAAFLLEGFILSLAPSLVVGLLLGALFCETPIRWSFGCAIPVAMYVVAICWLRHFDDGSGICWRTWSLLVLFIAIFCLFACVGARIRQFASKCTKYD